VDWVGGGLCVADGTCSTQRLMPRTHVVFHDGKQAAVTVARARARMLREFVSPLI